MHWVGSLFLCVCIVLLLCLWMPLRLSFCIRYHRGWCGELTIHYLWIRHTMPFSRILFRQPATAEAGASAGRGDTLQQWQQNTFVPIEWKPLAGFAAESLRIIMRRSRLNQLEFECRAGFSRPDITAYCCGLFWSVMGLVPEQWLVRSTIRFQPDFQNTRFEMQAKGIIEMPMGKAISIMISMAVLWLRRVNVQEAGANTRKREEQIAYES